MSCNPCKPITIGISGGFGGPGTPGPTGPQGPAGPPGQDATHIVSDTEPPPPEDIGALWICPQGDPIRDTGLVHDGPMIRTQPNGTPIGLSPDGQFIHQPEVIGAVPVIIQGKRYLLPVIEG